MFAFLKAGPVRDFQSVRPSSSSFGILANEVDSDADDEGIVGEARGEEGERIGLPRDNDAVKKIPDPRLPTQDEVDKHYVSGHVPYRSWCPVCVRARGRDRDHVKDSGKIGPFRNTALIIASPGMNWDSSGRYWWERKGDLIVGWLRRFR